MDTTKNENSNTNTNTVSVPVVGEDMPWGGKGVRKPQVVVDTAKLRTRRTLQLITVFLGVVCSIAGYLTLDSWMSQAMVGFFCLVGTIIVSGAIGILYSQAGCHAPTSDSGSLFDDDHISCTDLTLGLDINQSH